MLGLYNMRIKRVDMLELKITVKYDIDILTLTPISKYYIFIPT